VATASLRAQVLRMRNHPSIFTWLNGSDNPPTAEIEKSYLAVLKDANWPNVIISSATGDSTTVTGPSGVKMTGPYEWVPPSYWFVDHDKAGGAYGYNTETSPGPAFPTLESLRRFVPADQLWPLGDGLIFHAGQTHFAQLDAMTKGMNERYGPATSLEDYVNKAQAISYEGERAMFEAYSHNKYTSTGVIQWMLNNAWPSLIWHLYDYYLDPAAGYFGTRKANEPLHALYAHDDHAIYVVNGTYVEAKHLTLETNVLNFDLTRKFSSTVAVDLAADQSLKALALPEIPDLSTTYFVKLDLKDEQGKVVSHNFYWLSTKADAIDWDTKVFGYNLTLKNNDLTLLNSLGKVKLALSSKGSSRTGGEETSVMTVKNPSSNLAFMIHLRLLKANPVRPAWCNATSHDAGECSPEDILPILWEDNYFSLLPGEEREIKASYAAADAGRGAPVLEVSGWNIEPEKLTIAAK
jgi:exo-1,4-beta-D-glucosaminidase